MGFVGKEYNQSYMTYSVKYDGHIWCVGVQDLGESLERLNSGLKAGLLKMLIKYKSNLDLILMHQYKG